jgi:high affinity Mn2+ porin
MLPNRFVIGAVADASFPAFPRLAGLSIGSISTLTSPLNGAETYMENMIYFGTVRARVGYAPGNWLFSATGGFAWAYDQLTLTQSSTGAADTPFFLWRLGWAAGVGVEVPVAPHWTAGLEYLFTDYGSSSVTFPTLGQQFNSNFSVQELRASLNYRFADDSMPTKSKKMLTKAPAVPDDDRFDFHSQFTFTEQAYPAFRGPDQGPNSLPAVGEGRETVDATIFAGMRLWQGAELWVNPEIDQGFGVGNRHGAAGYPTAEAYKLGSDYPYAHVQRYFVRQNVNLGGDTAKVEADINQFAGLQSANRLVLTVGKFTNTDIFDTNKYANNSKSDLLNWSAINAGSFDYVGDGRVILMEPPPNGIRTAGRCAPGCPAAAAPLTLYGLGWMLGFALRDTLTRPYGLARKFTLVRAAVRLRLLLRTASRRQSPASHDGFPACSCFQLAVVSNSPREGLSPPIQCPCQAHHNPTGSTTTNRKRFT